MNSEGQEFGSYLDGWFWFRVSHGVAIKLSDKAAVLKDLTGAGKSISKLTHCWQEGFGRRLPFFATWASLKGC